MVFISSEASGDCMLTSMRDCATSTWAGNWQLEHQLQIQMCWCVGEDRSCYNNIMLGCALALQQKRVKTSPQVHNRKPSLEAHNLCLLVIPASAQCHSIQASYVINERHNPETSPEARNLT